MTQSAVTRPDANILTDYAPEEKFAEANNISIRTAERYRAQPDGLPFVEFGGRIYIPIEESREWLRSRIKRPNHERKSRVASARRII